MDSHGELIKSVLRQLITWTPPKEGITLLELFGGIGTCLEALLQLGMAVQRYFYIDIDPIVRQVAASRMMELKAKFPQQFVTTAWKASFTFLPFDIQLIQKKHMELLGPVDLIISGWGCQGFPTTRFGEGLSDTRFGLFMDMVQLITWAQSISSTLGYVIENTPSQLDQREKVQEHYALVRHYLGKPLLFDAAQCGSHAH
jgi:site-specific DNA-cytosine methylase